MNLSRAAWLRLLPFAAFMGLLALRGLAPADDRWGFDTRWLYAANLLVVGGMLAWWWRTYGELARALGGWWRLCTVARLIPRPLRDWVYGRVADNRYRLMGKAASCQMPDPALLKRLRE